RLSGKLCVLHLPSLDSKRFEDLQRSVLAAWPELRDSNAAYFERRFEKRYARRCEERELADVVVCNSSLTAASHIAAGADRRKVFVTPLGAPPPIAEAELRYSEPGSPLSVVWAGPFSLRKGAAQFLEAWRRLSAGSAAVADVFGSVAL